MTDLVNKMNKLFSSIHEEPSSRLSLSSPSASSISTLFRDDQKLSNVSNVVNHLINVVQLLVDEMNVMKKTCSSYSKYGPKMASIQGPAKIESSSAFSDMNLSKSRHVNVDPNAARRAAEEQQRQQQQQQRPLFQCGKCPMNFLKQEGLVKHMGMTHNKNRNRSRSSHQRPQQQTNSNKTNQGNVQRGNPSSLQNGHVSTSSPHVSTDNKNSLKINRNVVPMSKGPMPGRNLQPQPSAARSNFQQNNTNGTKNSRYNRQNRNSQSYTPTVPCTINGCKRKFTSSNSDEYLQHLQKDHQSNQQRNGNIANHKTESAPNVVEDGLEETFPCTVEGCIKSFNDIGNLEFHKLLVHNKNAPSTQSKVDLMVEAKSKLLDKNGDYVSNNAPTKTMPKDHEEVDTSKLSTIVVTTPNEVANVSTESAQDPLADDNSKTKKKIQNFRRERNFTCPHCQNKYLSKSTLTKHIDQQHQKDTVDEDKSNDWDPSPSKRSPPSTAKKSRSKPKLSVPPPPPPPPPPKEDSPALNDSEMKEEETPVDTFTIPENDVEDESMMIRSSLTNHVMTEEDHEMEIKREIRDADIPLEEC